MNKLEFPLLKAEQIEARISTVSEKGCSLLLYKDARCDMNILDETVGAYNWRREHSRDNANCVVSIWDESKNQWIGKEDTGTESNTEKAKGLASDSFKRACFNWGIGRELYTAPFIWISADKINWAEKNGKKTTYDTFTVSKIEYADRVITALEIMNNKKSVVYSLKSTTPAQSGVKENKEAKEPSSEDIICADCGKTMLDLKKPNGTTVKKEAVKEYSEKTYGRCLCLDCQKKAEQNKENQPETSGKTAAEYVKESAERDKQRRIDMGTNWNSVISEKQKNWIESKADKETVERIISEFGYQSVKYVQKKDFDAILKRITDNSLNSADDVPFDDKLPFNMGEVSA